MPIIPVSGEDWVEDTPGFREKVRVTRESVDALARSLGRMTSAIGRMEELTKGRREGVCVYVYVCGNGNGVEEAPGA
jgi:hypothetical protein